MNLREEMILSKELTHSIVHLMLVTITNQNPPQKYKEYVWVILFLQNIIYSSTSDHCFGEKSWGENSWHFVKEMAQIKWGGGKVDLF